VPRELSVEHSGSIIGRLSDEQLAAMVSELDRQMAELAKRAAGEDAKLIDTKAEQTPERGAATLGWRKPNPKTPPHELAQARERARRLAQARKAGRAAKQAQAQDCPKKPRLLHSSETEPLK